MVNKPALRSSSTWETMTTGGTYNNQPRRRGRKRARQNMNSMSSESGSEESGTNQLKAMLHSKKPSNRLVSPSKPGGEAAADEITRTVPQAGWPGPSGHRKAEVEPDSKMAPDIEPLNTRGKETRKRGKSRHDTLKNQSKRFSHNIAADAARFKRKEVSKMSYGSDTSISRESSISSRDNKRIRTKLKGSPIDDSFDTLLLKVEEAASKMNNPNDVGPSSRLMGKYGSKQSSKDSESMDNLRSMNSKSSYSNKSFAKSSGRSSAQSMESMDGHMELLESLVHAAHAEDKLQRGKKSLQRELQVLQQRNDKLEQELLYTLKVVDKLRTKCKHASRSSHDMESKFLAEKAKLEKELQASLKQEQVASNKDKSAPARKR